MWPQIIIDGLKWRVRAWICIIFLMWVIVWKKERERKKRDVVLHLMFESSALHLWSYQTTYFASFLSAVFIFMPIYFKEISTQHLLSWEKKLFVCAQVHLSLLFVTFVKTLVVTICLQHDFWVKHTEEIIVKWYQDLLFKKKIVCRSFESTV